MLNCGKSAFRGLRVGVNLSPAAGSTLTGLLLVRAGSAIPIGTVSGTASSSDMTGEQWTLLEAVFNSAASADRKHAPTCVA
jgi:hypothetical protein